MKNSLFTLLILCFGLNLSAQLRPKPMTPSKDLKGTQLDKPYLADIALSKCERYMRYYKRMIKLVITSQPSQSNPLEITKEISKARILYAASGTGDIVIDKTTRSIPFPPIVQFFIQPVNGVFPVEVSFFGLTNNQVGHNGPTSTVGLAWESGVYGDVVSVEDVYKIGTQAYADIKRSNGVVSQIKIFPQHLMDGCQIPIR